MVRISGAGAQSLASRILTAKEPLVARMATFTHVLSTHQEPRTKNQEPETAHQEPGTKNQERQALDQVIATFFPGPASYTGEDVVEIAAHGSPVVLEQLVREALAAGARMAEPGEFTLRAFLNGRIDLIQAEAVADLVNAVTPLQARAAFDQLEGTLTGAIGRIDAALFDLIARLEASIDFPDEGYHFLTRADVDEDLQRIAAEIDGLAGDARSGRIVREGREVVIAGTPNVGKSTLFNHLVGSERAIVTPVAGTTRDLVTETIDLCGVRVCLVDTAGVRQANDLIESEGVRRAMGAAAIADLVVVVLDRSRPLEQDDRQLLAQTASAERVIAINKCDLAAAWSPRDLGIAPAPIEVSLGTGEGVADLKQRIADALIGAGRLRDVPMITNVRHIELLAKAAQAIARGRSALAASQGELPEEFLLADLQEAQAALEEVTGRRTSDDLLRHIFGRFCVGK